MAQKTITEVIPRPSTYRIRITSGEGLIGAEIGVDKGLNAYSIYTVLKPKELYLIDCWDNFMDCDSGEIIGEAQYQIAYSLFKNIPSVHIIRKTSLEAVKQFDDNSLDFVYIDASHQYEMVRQDLELWYPKVKSGGVLCGHDFDIKAASGGVVKAVSEFVNKVKKNASLEHQDWMIKK